MARWRACYGWQVSFGEGCATGGLRVVAAEGSMRPVTSGSLLVATGIVHDLFGLLLGFGLLAPPGGTARNFVADMAAAGILDSVGHDPWRMTFFWFEVTGTVLVVLGALMHRCERSGMAMPGWLGWSLGGIALGCVLLVPASGFWLLFPQAWLLVRRAHAARRAGRGG